ncbi:MAG: hypothetical protein ABIY71_11510 [Flavobacteriales bacterium]
MKNRKDDALRLKELENLELFHQRMKAEAEAWQKLLENMNKMKSARADIDQPQKPTE